MQRSLQMQPPSLTFTSMQCPPRSCSHLQHGYLPISTAPSVPSSYPCSLPFDLPNCALDDDNWAAVVALVREARTGGQDGRDGRGRQDAEMAAYGHMQGWDACATPADTSSRAARARQ